MEVAKRRNLTTPNTTESMKAEDLRIGQVVYHRQVYHHNEALKITGLTETHVELEGDYSGGIHNITERSWLPINGLSLIENHTYKKECRDYAVTAEELLRPVTNRNQDSTTRTMFDLLDMVFRLTNDISLNPEIE
jgi:hypothetical protein